MDITKECQGCRDRAKAAMKDLLVRVKKEFGVKSDININDGWCGDRIGTLTFTLKHLRGMEEENTFHINFKGIGHSQWSHRLSYDRYKVSISSYAGYNGLNDTHLFEKGGTLDIDKVIATVRERHHGWCLRVENEHKAKVARNVGQEVIDSLRDQINEIKGYTRITPKADGSFSMEINDLDEVRLRRIVGVLTIHHKKGG